MTLPPPASSEPDPPAGDPAPAALPADPVAQPAPSGDELLALMRAADPRQFLDRAFQSAGQLGALVGQAARIIEPALGRWLLLSEAVRVPRATGRSCRSR